MPTTLQKTLMMHKQVKTGIMMMTIESICNFGVSKVDLNASTIEKLVDLESAVFEEPLITKINNNKELN